jgi:alkylation response protein AidB-like acyl-CoA dehydrogenase
MTSRVFPRYGSEIEYAEPAWYQGLPTAYYNESHVAWRARVRDFVERELKPHVSDWEEKEDTMPIKQLCKKMVALGLYGRNYPKEYGGGGGLNDTETFDVFHSLVFADELGRTGAGGVTTALTVGVAIGLGPVIAGGSEALKKRVATEVLHADKFICLAVTEAQAGSDVSAVRTTATLDPTRRFYIVSGEKKFISGASYADYFTTAVKTDKGVSVLLVERGPGVSVRRLKTQGWLASNTGFVIFDNVKV